MMTDGDTGSLPVVLDDEPHLDGADVCPTCGRAGWDPQDSRLRDRLFEQEEEIQSNRGNFPGS